MILVFIGTSQHQGLEVMSVDCHCLQLLIDIICEQLG